MYVTRQGSGQKLPGDSANLNERNARTIATTRWGVDGIFRTRLCNLEKRICDTKGHGLLIDAKRVCKNRPENNNHGYWTIEPWAQLPKQMLGCEPSCGRFCESLLKIGKQIPTSSRPLSFEEDFFGIRSCRALDKLLQESSLRSWRYSTTSRGCC